MARPGRLPDAEAKAIKERRAGAILAVLTDAARAGAPCPSDMVLCDSADLDSGSSAQFYLRMLIEAEKIRLERKNSRRRIEVVGVGHTDWSSTGGSSKPLIARTCIRCRREFAHHEPKATRRYCDSCRTYVHSWEGRDGGFDVTYEVRR